MEFYHEEQYQRSFLRDLKVVHPELPKENFIYDRGSVSYTGHLVTYKNEFLEKTEKYLKECLSAETLSITCDEPLDFYQFCKDRCVEAYEQATYDLIFYHDEIIKIFNSKEENCNFSKRNFYEFELYRRDPREWIKQLESDAHAVVFLQRPLDIPDIVFERVYDPYQSFGPRACTCAANSLVVIKHAKNPQLKEYALQILIDSLQVVENLNELKNIEKLKQAQKVRQKGKRANVFKVDALQKLQKQCGGPGVKSVSERKKCFRKWANENNTNNDNNILIPVFIWDLLVPFFDRINMSDPEKEAIAKRPPYIKSVDANGYDIYQYDPELFKLHCLMRAFFAKNEKLLLQGGKRHRQFENDFYFINHLPELVETYKEIKKRGLW